MNSGENIDENIGPCFKDQRPSNTLTAPGEGYDIIFLHC